MKKYIDELSLEDKHLDSYSIQWSHHYTDIPPNGEWSIALYKNGELCTDDVYLELLYASNLTDFPTSESSHCGNKTTDTWTTKSAYVYQANFWSDNTKTRLLCSELLNPSYDKNTLLNTLYPINSIYITSTNKAPSIGGTWELVKKDFKDAQGNSSSSLFTKNTTNTDTFTVNYRRAGNTLVVRLSIKTLADAGDSTLTYGTLDLAALGVSSLAPTTITMVPRGSEAGLFIMSCSTAGKITSVDVRPKSNSGTTIAAGSTFYFYENFSLRAEDMIDSFCDKFYWKRVS